MTPLPHHYDVRLSGGPTGYAPVSSHGLPELRTAPPADYGGPGDAWSPEHLKGCLVSASLSTPIRLEPEIQEAPEAVPVVSRGNS